VILQSAHYHVSAQEITVTQKIKNSGQMQDWAPYTVKKGLAIFPTPAGMSLTKLSLDGNNLIIPAQGEFGQ
jgi:hypothetical protein